MAGQEAEREAEEYITTAMKDTQEVESKSLVELHKERMVEKKKNKKKVTQEELDKIREEKVRNHLNMIDIATRVVNHRVRIQAFGPCEITLIFNI